MWDSSSTTSNPERTEKNSSVSQEGTVAPEMHALARGLTGGLIN